MPRRYVVVSIIIFFLLCCVVRIWEKKKRPPCSIWGRSDVHSDEMDKSFIERDEVFRCSFWTERAQFSRTNTLSTRIAVFQFAPTCARCHFSPRVICFYSSRRHTRNLSHSWLGEVKDYIKIGKKKWQTGGRTRVRPYERLIIIIIIITKTDRFYSFSIYSYNKTW